MTAQGIAVRAQEKTTHAEDHGLLDEAGELPQAAGVILAGATAPQHAGLGIGGNVDGLEGDAVGAQDGLEARGGGDDVGGAGGERGEDVEGRVGRVGGHYAYWPRAVYGYGSEADGIDDGQEARCRRARADWHGVPLSHP